MCPSFEEAVLNKIDNAKQLDKLTPLEENYFKEYSREVEDGRINPEDFLALEDQGVYIKGEIKKDIGYVQAMKSRESSGTKRGALLEGIISRHAELSEWFGEKSNLIFLSEYDDRMSHSDLLLEMENIKGESLKLLMDVTTSVDENRIDEKISQSYDSLGNVKLGKVKYFESIGSDQRGKIYDIPRVVIGIDPNTLRDLCDSIKEKKNKQQDHYVQFMILEEVENQLIHMKEALICKGKDAGVAFFSVNKLLNHTRSLLGKKEDLRPLDYEKKVSGDKAYRFLRY